MVQVKFQGNAKRLDFIPLVSETALKAETPLVSADFSCASVRGGPLTQYILAAILETREWRAIEDSEEAKSGKIVPTITTRIGLIRGNHGYDFPIWRGRIKTVEDTLPEYHFTVLMSSVPGGVQHRLFIDDSFSCDIDDTLPPLTTQKILDEAVTVSTINNPPKLKIQIDGELWVYNHSTLTKLMPPHEDGWLYMFDLKYSDTPAFSNLL